MTPAVAASLIDAVSTLWQIKKPALTHKDFARATDGDDDSSPNTLEYPSGDDHPSQAGNQKATAKFVPLLNNVYENFIATPEATTNTQTSTPTASPTSAPTASPTASPSIIPSSSTSTPTLEPTGRGAGLPLEAFYVAAFLGGVAVIALAFFIFKKQKK